MTDICDINWFVERDIDMLLAEELRVSAEFCRWVTSKTCSAADLQFPAISTNVSVIEDGSEADVVATFAFKSGGLHRLFIENKIDAGLQPDQLARYVRRGEGELGRGKISTFSVLFFTPSAYAATPLPNGVSQITFEAAADFLSSLNDPRALYRASLLMKALPLRSTKLRDNRVAEGEPYIREWWDAVYAAVEIHFPGFFIHKTRYPRSVYFAPEMAGQGVYLRLDFKGHKGEVDLAFKNVLEDDLKSALTHASAYPGQVVSNGRSSALRIENLEPFVISEGIAVIETKVIAAYRAAHSLLTFWSRNRFLFESFEVPHGEKSSFQGR